MLLVHLQNLKSSDFVMQRVVLSNDFVSLVHQILNKNSIFFNVSPLY